MIQGLEVTVPKAIFWMLETLETGEPPLFLHGLKQFVSIWKTMGSYEVSMRERPVAHLLAIKTFSLAATIQ